MEETGMDNWLPPKADKLEGPKIVGKINLHKIDNSTRPKKKRPLKLFKDRDYLDSGWGHSFILISQNFHKEQRKNNKRSK